MKDSKLRIDVLLLIVGAIILLIGIGRMIYIKVTAAPQDEVVSEGFSPILVPDNLQEIITGVNNPEGITPIAPEIATLAPSTDLTPSDLPGSEMSTQSSTRAVAPVEPAVTPTFGPAIPERIVIPAIDLDAPVIEAKSRKIRVDNQIFDQYIAPDEFAAGWHPNSALLGVPGNTVLNGHHNVYGEVFGKLVDLQPGDKIYVYSGQRRYTYIIANKLILPEFGPDITLKQRLQNARWILPSEDERLTLVTCWPAYSNTHRLIIVASPLGMDEVSSQK